MQSDSDDLLLTYTNTRVFIRSEMRYHGEEDAELGIHVDHISVGEDKLLLLVLLTLQNDVDLLGGDRKHRQLDAVKLIKAAPGSGLSQTCRHSTALSGQHFDRTITCLLHVKKMP